MALISLGDRRHADAVRLFETFPGRVYISPYSPMELDLLLRSKELIVRDPAAFYDAIGDLLKYRGIGTFPIKPEYHREAFKLRETYRPLTFFDSLHAAVGISEGLEMVSYDREYAKLPELKYSHPDEYIRV